MSEEKKEKQNFYVVGDGKSEEVSEEVFKRELKKEKIAVLTIEHIKELIKNDIENKTEKEIAIYSLTKYQKYLISLGKTEKDRAELTEKEIKMNLKMLENKTKEDIISYLMVQHTLESET